MPKLKPKPNKFSLNERAKDLATLGRIERGFSSKEEQKLIDTGKAHKLFKTISKTFTNADREIFNEKVKKKAVKRG